MVPRDLEFRGVPRQEFSPRASDAGSPGIPIRIGAIGKLLETMKGQGVRVLSKDGGLVEWSQTLRNACVRDPDGFDVELVGDAAR